MPRPIGPLLSLEAVGVIGGHRRVRYPRLVQVVTSHLDLTDRDQEDHTKYGPLAAANQWAAYNRFLHSLRAPLAGFGTSSPTAGVYVLSANAGIPTAETALAAGIGTSPGPPFGGIIGISGGCLSRNAANSYAFGLDFYAGAHSLNLATAYGVNTSLYSMFGAAVLAQGIALRVASPTLIAASIAALYGFKYELQTGVPVHRPIYDTNPPTNAAFSLHRSTLQLFGAAPSFGGGAGVLGIADATVLPFANPVGGGILFSSGGALFWHGPGGTVTPIAPP